MKVIAGEPAKTFINDKGEEKKVLNLGVADGTRAAKPVVYDESKFNRITIGKSVMVCNLIKKTDHIIISTQMKVFPTQDVVVSEKVALDAKYIINPPSADVKPLKDALLSPKDSKGFCEGQEQK